MINGYGFATTCNLNVSFGYEDRCSLAGKSVLRKEGYMQVFKAFLVNVKDETLIREATVVGKDEVDAATTLSLSANELVLRKKDYLEILWQDIGEFQSRRPSRVAIDD